MGRNKKAKKASGHDAASDAGSDHPQEDQQEVTEVADEVPAAEASDDEGTQKKEKKLSKKALQRMEQQKRAAEAPPSKKGKGKKKKGDTSSDDEDEPLPTTTATTAAPPAPESESESDDDLPEVYPLKVTYCPNCTFPIEMCEFSGMFEKCKPFLIELIGEEALANLTEKGRKRKIATEAEKLEALLSREGKNKLEKHVVMEVKSRGNGRFLTYIRGLDLFGVNIKELCKDFKKQFATGAGITSEPGKLDAIEVQGEFVDQVAEIIMKRFNIAKDAIYKKEGKNDVPLFGERPQTSEPQERKPKKSGGKMALDQQQPDFESGEKVTKAKILVAEKREKVVKEEPEPRGRLFGPKTTDANRGRGGGSRGACFNCGQEGHMSRDCPTPKSRGGGPGEGRGRGDARGRV